MKSQVSDTVLETLNTCTRASDSGTMAFPRIVQALSAAGVERYHADLVRAEKTYYLPDGRSATIANDEVAEIPADSFCAAGVEAAIRASQAGAIDYKTFCKRVVGAGCVGYHVSLAGRRAVYYGRTGDLHVEWFPGAR